MDCLSTSNCVSRLGDGGRTVDANARGEAGLVLPLDVGLELGGDSRSRGGSFGDGARCSGEMGREGARELLMYVVSTGAGRGFLLPLLSEDDEERGDCAYGSSLGELVDSALRNDGGGRSPESRRPGSGRGW